jgi:phospholipase A1
MRWGVARQLLALLLMWAAGAAVAQAPDEDAPGRGDEAASATSVLDEQWALGDDDDRRAFSFSPYRPNYILPLSYRADRGSGVEGEADRLELEFQLSFKTRVWSGALLDRGAMWFGFTQRSFWQAYSESAPFRETNYEPELRYAYELGGSFRGWRPRVLTIGLNHQSNGRSGDESRSWNRLTGGLAAERGDLSLSARGWWRLPESGEDDNPGIVDRVGRGELRARYDVGGHTVSSMLRSNFEAGDPRGAIRVSYAFPLNRAFRGYIRAFHGYGDSLIDYDEVSSRLGVGIALSVW